MSENHEDYYPPICFYCDSRLSSVTLEKCYNWNREKQGYEPDSYEEVFACPHCLAEVGERTESGMHKWYTPEELGIAV